MQEKKKLRQTNKHTQKLRGFYQKKLRNGGLNRLKHFILFLLQHTSEYNSQEGLTYADSFLKII